MKRLLCALFGHRWIYQRGAKQPLRFCARCPHTEIYRPQMRDGWEIPGTWETHIR